MMKIYHLEAPIHIFYWSFKNWKEEMMPLKFQLKEVIVVIMAIIATIVYWTLVTCTVSFYIGSIKIPFNEETEVQAYQ